MKVKTQKEMLKPEFKVAAQENELLRIPNDAIVKHLEEGLKIREMTLAQRIKKGMLR